MRARKSGVAERHQRGLQGRCSAFVTSPQISFAIACYNAAPFLAQAVESALAQDGVSLEVLIVDDHSTDNSVAIAQAFADRDSRVRILQTPMNMGPAGARNVALAESRGDWFAILDGDDFLHPDRSLQLLAEAEKSQADVIADDLLIFDESGAADPQLFLDRARGSAENWIDLPGYLAETRMFGRRPNLGFLKPMYRKSFLSEHAIRYDESLRIAEDDALAIAALVAGARYRLMPKPYYFYRKHSSSISHRLSGNDAARMLDASEKLQRRMADNPDAAAQFAIRHRSTVNAWAFAETLDALKAGHLPKALGLIARHPRSWPLFRSPVIAALRRIGRKLRPPKPVPEPDPNGVLLISRQRIIGPTNGSSSYIIAIAQAFRKWGMACHLVQPTGRVFGRTPFFRLMPEMDIFSSVSVFKSLRVGRWLIARDPHVWWAAAQGVLARILRKLGFSGGLAEDKVVPPSISLPWERAELLYVARQSGLGKGAFIADYLFQSAALPYLLSPGVPTAIVMHDLFHARAAQFGDGRSSDSVAQVEAADEIRMLGQANAVIAIQAEEAAFVSANVPDTQALLVPMPAFPVSRGQSGNGENLLFVGSNTAPNIIALQWFFENVWDEVLAHRPYTVLDIAGSVSRAFDTAPKGVRFHGIVPDLSPMYEHAGIVLSPLKQGSGLKIKLIEALAKGKACVVTSVTLQGVEEQLGPAVLKADTPGEFAAAIALLQDDEAMRRDLADRGLAAVNAQFGPDRCFAPLRDWMASAAS